MEIRDIYGDLPRLETPRLILRKMTMGDAADMFEYASDPEVPKYLPWEAHKTIEDSRTFLKSVLDHYEKAEMAGWGIEHKRDRKLIGTITFQYWLIPHKRAEVGYALSRAYWNRGIMTEALRTIISFGFERMDLNRVEAGCDVNNIGSWRVMEKSGMKLEGVLRQRMFVKGTFRDFRLYSILRDEWVNVQSK